MEKCINKLKGTGVEAIAEAIHAQASIGVCTRSKTLALQYSQVLSIPSSAVSTIIAGIGGERGSYLQLRSRRLERSPLGGTKGKRQKKRKKYSELKSKGKGPTNGKQKSKKKLKKGLVLEENENGKKKGPMFEENENNKEKGQMLEENENNKRNISIDDLEVVDALCRENVLEIENHERATRETTPCNMMIPDPINKPPRSSTRHAYRSNTIRIVNIPMLYNFVPVTDELNQSFAAAEEKERNKFIEKYNFDPLKDEPLPGRFEWEKLKP